MLRNSHSSVPSPHSAGDSDSDSEQRTEQSGIESGGSDPDGGSDPKAADVGSAFVP